MLEISPFVVLKNTPRNGQSFESWLAASIAQAELQSQTLQKLLDGDMIPKSLAIAAEQHHRTLLAVQQVL